MGTKTMYKNFNTLEYISQKSNNVLFDILSNINKELDKKSDNSLEIIRKKIIFIIRIRCDK